MEHVRLAHDAYAVCISENNKAKHTSDTVAYCKTMLYKGVYVCVYVCVCMCVYMYVCVCVCVCMHVCNKSATQYR